MKSIQNLGSIVALALLSGVTWAQNLSIATGGTGGVYYPYGGGLAAVLSKNIPEIGRAHV